MVEETGGFTGGEASHLLLLRQEALADRERLYEVYVDDEVVGTIADGSTLTIPLRPGRHKIHATIDWCRSNVLNVDIGAGAQKTLRISPRATGLLFLICFVFLLVPQRHIRLREQ